jgi:GNAT superfamily N-acetyltransferase
MSLDPLPVGEMAAIVTYLEMDSRPDGSSVPGSPLRLEHVTEPEPPSYRELFRLVGTPWLWFSRLEMSDEELSAIIRDPNVDLYEVRDGDETVGMLELDFRAGDECELAYVGLVPAYSGKGHGRWLLAEAIDRAWREGIRRVHVHTCTLDHPAAISAYRRAGFVPVSQAIERFKDPRLAGLYTADAAPQVPLLGAGTT